MFLFCEKLWLLIGGFKAPKPTPKTALDFIHYYEVIRLLK